MKKPMLVVVMLTVVTVAIVPALAQEEVAQEERCPDQPDVPCRLNLYSGGYEVLYIVSCAAVYDPDTSCIVDENGLIDLPDGTITPSRLTTSTVSTDSTSVWTANSSWSKPTTLRPHP